MSVKETVKILLAKENLTLTHLAKIMTQKIGKNIKMDSLSQKMRKGTMKFEEVEFIAECLNYRINFEKIN